MNHYKELLTLALLFGVGSAVAGEPLSSPEATGKEYVAETESVPVLMDPVRSNVDLTAGASYLYDSNTIQLDGGEGGFVGVADFGVNYGYGDESARGAYVGMSYLGQSFFYDDSATRAGRDTLEHQIGAYFGLTGGRTRFRLNSSVGFNNGNAVDLESYDREIRRAEGNDYAIDASIIRDLPHGTLEFGAGTVIHDFAGGTQLNDGENYYGDAAWFYQPGFAPKSAFGLGVRGSRDSYDGNGAQESIAPSFRWRYELSGKTSLYTSTGYEFRSIDGGNDTETFVYDLGATWAATSKTTFGVSSYRNVQPSFVSDGQNFTATGVALTMSQQLPADFMLASNAGYEVADYSGTESGVFTNREDDYLKAGISLSRGLSLWGGLDGTISLFYNFAENDSTEDLIDFDQHVTGVRMGLVY